jgi:hypothetical protein
MDASELRNVLRVAARILDDGETRAPAGRGESLGGRASGGDVLTGTFWASKKGLVTGGQGRILRSTLNPRVKPCSRLPNACASSTNAFGPTT